MTQSQFQNKVDVINQQLDLIEASVKSIKSQIKVALSIIDDAKNDKNYQLAFIEEVIPTLIKYFERSKESLLVVNKEIEELEKSC